MQKPIKIIANWKSILIIFIILLCIQTPGLAVTEVTLQWDHSIDEPYLANYKVYYGTASGNTILLQMIVQMNTALMVELLGFR